MIGDKIITCQYPHMFLCGTSVGDWPSHTCAMRRLSVLAAALTIAACADAGVTPGVRPTISREVTPAATATSSPASTATPMDSTPSPTPTRIGTTTLTEEDSGSTVVLKVGESVRVTLSSDYHQPEAQGSAVERRAASGGYPTSGPAIATFVAVARGSAELTSTTDYGCLHATPSCALPQQLWSARITVS